MTRRNKQRLQNTETGEVLNSAQVRQLKREEREGAIASLTEIFGHLNIKPEHFKKEFDRMIAYCLNRDEANYNRELQAVINKAREKYFPDEAKLEQEIARRAQRETANEEQ